MEIKMRFAMVLTLAILLTSTIWSTGCSYMSKGATADKIIDYMTRGEDDPQAVVIPAGLISPGQPAIVFPSVPGKDFTATLTQLPDGGYEFSIVSERSGTLDRLAAAALGIGDQAIDRDAQLRQEIREERSFWLDFFGPMIQGGFANANARFEASTAEIQNPTPQPTRQDTFREWLALANDPEFQQFMASLGGADTDPE